MVKPVVFQACGFQNSGKTLLVTNLLSSLSKSGFTTVTIKHHGHGGKPDLPVEKDSSRHITAGAAATLVEGDGRVIIHGENASWPLSKKIQFMSLFEPDFIIVEGHKHENYPKAILIRTEEDLFLLKQLQEVKVILFHEELEGHSELAGLTIPCFPARGHEGVQWITRFLKENAHS
ncbi:molybdopterin-guanine dinucleotide biosynthesis protein B [Bacillus canaveralius]|uniref:Molybdopterin-guanine dinucleotide biosynthesis protein B n=1 Tax=Bacillus canaveralius TaxID=1403243 RepID=A0A2N5GKG7_9BACI|nr:molybdopterin-guanine dinucleotide biosynthesis protein B [Bacillus canaveralius]PLR82001.1 molybdopterin-guanine dinucleotide biosynthesis protein B [Bacillus canaveralius]PLR99387.1 molybdopterin-guanine dinucleotide biosynthesis protein B [Bacillus canaveralius]